MYPKPLTAGERARAIKELQIKWVLKQEEKQKTTAAGSKDILNQHPLPANS